MARCVEITMEDDGTITVNECEPKEEAAEGYEKMPAETFEDAFDIAKQILTSDLTSGETDSEEPSEEQKGFDSVQGMFTQQKGI